MTSPRATINTPSCAAARDLRLCTRPYCGSAHFAGCCIAITKDEAALTGHLNAALAACRTTRWPPQEVRGPEAWQQLQWQLALCTAGMAERRQTRCPSPFTFTVRSTVFRYHCAVLSERPKLRSSRLDRFSSQRYPLCCVIACTYNLAQFTADEGVCG